MNELYKKVIDQIKEQHITPKPRWQFFLKQWLIWVATGLSIVVGSMAFCVLLFRMVNNDWEIVSLLNRTPLQHFFDSLPLVWLLLVALFVGLAYYNARHTKGAYRYQAYWFLIGGIFLSISFGGLLYTVGFGPKVHTFVDDRLPFINHMMEEREERWIHPESGLLAGQITTMLSGASMFELVDFDRHLWVVVPAPDYLPPPPQFQLVPGVQVRMTGEEVDFNTFEADRIMPYHIGPGMMSGRIRVLMPPGNY